MTQKELSEKMYALARVGSGSYKVTIEYRNKLYYCTSHNSLAWDAIMHDDYSSYTAKQAMQALYDECKRKNGLN